MRLLAAVAALSVSLLVAGCATARPDMTFDAGAQDAFVVVAGDGMRINGSESNFFTFREIDLTTLEFSRQLVSVNFGAMGPPLDGNDFRRPSGLLTSMRFAGKTAPPGDYVLITRRRSITLGTFTQTYVSCFSEGAPVFRFRAGAINVVEANAIHAHGSVREQTAAVLSEYPNMTAPQIPAELLGLLRFESSTWLGSPICAPKSTPVFTPVGELAVGQPSNLGE